MADLNPVTSGVVSVPDSETFVGEGYVVETETSLDTYDCDTLPSAGNVAASNNYARFCDGVADNIPTLSEADVQRIAAAMLAQQQAAARAEAARKAAEAARIAAENAARTPATPPAPKTPECPGQRPNEGYSTCMARNAGEREHRMEAAQNRLEAQHERYEKEHEDD